MFRKEFDRVCLVGFYSSMQKVPIIFANKEDVVGKKAMEVDMTDKEGIAKMSEEFRVAGEKAMKNAPIIKTMIAGTFLEMVERGHFEL